MKLFLIFLTLMCVTDSQEQIKHHDMIVIICSDVDKEYVKGLDEEERYYADFVKKVVVDELPPFADPLAPPVDEYQAAEAEQDICKNNFRVYRTELKDQPEPQDVPQNSIYPRDDVNLGSVNTLICHSMRFFPPPIRVRWTRNGEDVTDQSTLSQFYPNEDNTYNQFSHLTFTPQEGDIYTCMVEHKETNDTKTWEVDVELPSVGSSVFCGVGLAVGLLGVATGTFFLVKGNQCN